jgi:hypothetical protein
MKYVFGAVMIILSVFVMGLASEQASAQLSGSGDSELTFPSGDSAITSPSGSDCPKGVCIQNPIKADNIIELFETIIDIVLVFAVPIIVFFIIYAGFMYVTARGNESKISQAHMALLYALIGGVLILGAKVLIAVISGTVETFYD